jgi:hypothetical protein
VQNRKMASLFGFGTQKAYVSRSQTPTSRSERTQTTTAAFLQEAASNANAFDRSQQQQSVSRSETRAELERQGEATTNIGLPRNMLEHFDLGRVLAQGGNAVVVRAVSRRTGKEYACKCIPKVRRCLLDC